MRAEEFFAFNTQLASAGYETSNLGTKNQHVTPRPLKPKNSPYDVKNTTGNF
jgi:hypothetical protein